MGVHSTLNVSEGNIRDIIQNHLPNISFDQCREILAIMLDKHYYNCWTCDIEPYDDDLIRSLLGGEKSDVHSER